MHRRSFPPALRDDMSIVRRGGVYPRMADGYPHKRKQGPIFSFVTERNYLDAPECKQVIKTVLNI
jgi:hypothetical protein